MGLDLQPGGLIAVRPSHCQPHINHPVVIEDKEAFKEAQWSRFAVCPH